MSRQNKLRNRRKHAVSGNKGPNGASGLPHRQMAPPWVKNGKRKPKAVKEKEEKLRQAQAEAAREARKQAEREAAHAE